MISFLMRFVARLPIRFPRTVVVVSLILTVVAALFLPRLHVSTDRNLLSGKDNQAFIRRDEVSRLFGTTLVSVVVFNGETAESVRAAADDLAVRLGKRPDIIRDVFHRADIGFFEDHALMFASVETVRKMANILGDDDAEINLIGDLDSLHGMISLGAHKLEEQQVPEDAKSSEVNAGFDFIGGLLDDVATWFEKPETTSFGIVERLWEGSPSFQGGAGNEGYLTENDNRTPHLAVLFVQPANDSQAMEVVEPLTDLIREEAAAVAAAHRGTGVMVTGMPSLQTDELRLVTRDCMVAGTVAGLGVLLVFLIAFRSFRVTLFLVIPLGVGLIWAAGFTGAVYGHLTMITSYFAAVLFGLGVAFTIHIVARFHEALRGGQEKVAAIETALVKAGPGTVVGGVTTVMAFLTIAFSEFQGFAEMGIISGVGVAMILVANLTLLPAALLLWHPCASAVRTKEPRDAFWVNMGRSRVIVLVITAAAVIAGLAVANLNEFDYAVENMLPADCEAVKGIRTLDARTDFSSTFTVAVASSVGEAAVLRDRFAALPTVSRVEAISMFVPPDQDEKVAIIVGIDPARRDEVKKIAQRLHARHKKMEKTTAAELADALQELGDTFEDLSFDAKKVGRAEAAGLATLSGKAAAAAKIVAKSGDDERARALGRQVFEVLVKGMEILAAGMEDRGFGVDDLPLGIRGRFVSANGEKYAVIAYPKGDMGDRDFFYGHVDEILSVDPGATGHPVTHKAFTIMVHKGFAQAAAYSGIAVILLLLLDLRSFRGLMLALMPVIVAASCTSLVIYLTGYKLNYANLMAFPILIGTGVDYGAHLAHRAKQEGSVREAARTTGRAIALSGVTTLIGFGSLILGNHWGVRSLGILLTLGIFFTLVAALIVLPGLFRDPVTGQTRQEERQP